MGFWGAQTLRSPSSRPFAAGAEARCMHAEKRGPGRFASPPVPPVPPPSCYFLKNFLLRRKMSRLTLTLALSNIFMTATPSYCSCSRSCRRGGHHHGGGKTGQGEASPQHNCPVPGAGPPSQPPAPHLVVQLEPLHVDPHEFGFHLEPPGLLAGHDVEDDVLEPGGKGGDHRGGGHASTAAPKTRLKLPPPSLCPSSALPRLSLGAGVRTG